MAKQTNGQLPRHVLVFGGVEFEDFPFSGAMVTILDDRIIDWEYFGGRRDTSKPIELIEVGLSVGERFEALSKVLKPVVHDVEVHVAELPPEWTFENLREEKWEIFDFANYVNMKAVGKPVIPW